MLSVDIVQDHNAASTRPLQGWSIDPSIVIPLPACTWKILFVTCIPSAFVSNKKKMDGILPKLPTIVLWSTVASSPPSGPSKTHPFGDTAPPAGTHHFGLMSLARLL